MKTIIIGSRQFRDYNYIAEKLTEIHKKINITNVLVAANEVGIDQHSKHWAVTSGIAILDLGIPETKPKLKKLVTACELLIAFRGESDNQAVDSFIAEIQKTGKPYYIIETNKYS